MGSRAVLAAGVALAANTVLYDLVNEREVRGSREEPLEVPPGAVVVPGMRPAGGGYARRIGLSQACALIVKYRTSSTDAATALEEVLRAQVLADVSQSFGPGPRGPFQPLRLQPPG